MADDLRITTIFGMHEIRGDGGYVICRVDIDPLVPLTPEVKAIVREHAQHRADAVAHRDFYHTHVLATPRGQLEQRSALARVQGYTIERNPRAASPTEEQTK